MSEVTLDGDDMPLCHVSLLPDDESWYKVGMLPPELHLSPVQFEAMWSLHPDDYGKV